MMMMMTGSFNDIDDLLGMILSIKFRTPRTYEK